MPALSMAATYASPMHVSWLTFECSLLLRTPPQRLLEAACARAETMGGTTPALPLSAPRIITSRSFHSRDNRIFHQPWSHSRNPQFVCSVWVWAYWLGDNAVMLEVQGLSGLSACEIARRNTIRVVNLMIDLCYILRITNVCSQRVKSWVFTMSRS